MLLRIVAVAGISDIVVFQDGSTEELAVWNHVNDGTHCLVSEFDIKIRPLLNAHGIGNIELEDYILKRKQAGG